jgi:hypothetical protein
MKVFRVSQFDQHRHHGTSRILFRMQVGDRRISCTSISQCRITIAEEAVRPRSQTPPDRGLSRCLRGNVGFVHCA